MKVIFSSIQWTMFILAGTVVAPLAIGAAFHLSSAETAGMLGRTLFVLGLSSLLQVFFGHKLPIAEGPAGLWWGVFLIFASLVTGNTNEKYTVLQNLEMGLIVSGVLFLLISAAGWIRYIQQIFTPLAIGTYLILLCAQLSGSFIKGMLGIGYLTPGVDARVAFLSFFILVLSILLARSRIPMLRSYSVLIGLAVGWVLFALFHLVKPSTTHVNTLLSLPEVFPWGGPKLDTGVLITSLVTALLLLTNLITSVDVVNKVVGRNFQPNYKSSAIVMGINQMLAALFSTVGLVPVSSSAGFIIMTRMKERLPFIIGSILILVMSFVPSITLFFSSIPIPVGYATIFLSFIHLIGIGLREYEREQGEEKFFIIGMALMVGIGTMFIPPESLAHLPHWITPMVNNGLILGVITCIIVEQGLKFRHNSNYHKVNTNLKGGNKND